jgi:hypothetical protein
MQSSEEIKTAITVLNNFINNDNLIKLKFLNSDIEYLYDEFKSKGIVLKDELTKELKQPQKKLNPSIKITNSLKDTRLKSNVLIYYDKLHFCKIKKNSKFTVRENNSLTSTKLVELELSPDIIGKEFLFKESNPFQYFWSFYSREDDNFYQYCIIPSKTHFGKLVQAVDSNKNPLKWIPIVSGTVILNPINNAKWCNIIDFPDYKTKFKNWKEFIDIKLIGNKITNSPFYLNKGDTNYLIADNNILYFVSNNNIAQGYYNNKKQIWKGYPI